MDPVFAFIPPPNGKNGPPERVDAAIPLSLITLSETKETMLFNVPVLVLLTILSTVLEFVGPILVKNLNRYFEMEWKMFRDHMLNLPEPIHTALLGYSC